MAERRQSLADVTKYLFDRWIDDNAEFLLGYNLTRENFHAADDGRGQLINYPKDA